VTDAQHAEFVALAREGGATVSGLLGLCITEAVRTRSSTGGARLAAHAARQQAYGRATQLLAGLSRQLDDLRPSMPQIDPKARARFAALRKGTPSEAIDATTDAATESPDEFSGLTDDEIEKARSIPAGPKRDKFITARLAKRAKQSAKKGSKK
jgi:hypothetical protein